MRSNKESGFSLVEMAIVVFIIGLLTAGAMSMLRPYLEMSQANLTRKKLENISLALSNFAQVYGRLPCPAAPSPGAEIYGTPRKSGTDGDEVAEHDCGTTIGSQIGIIPFRALGLDEDQARDNYGNLITYAVSPAMTNDDYTLTNMNSGRVHPMCRTKLWIDEYNVNKNPLKARVCCPDWDTNDIKVVDARVGGDSVLGITPRAAADNYNSPNSIETAVPQIRNRLIAFVLISHGRNGDAAYLEPNAGITETSAPTNAEESENRNKATNTDLNFVSRPISLENGNDYFDDIVVWKTNDQLISILGKDSCARP